MDINNSKTTLFIGCLTLTMLGHSPQVCAAGGNAVYAITQQAKKITEKLLMARKLLSELLSNRKVRTMLPLQILMETSRSQCHREALLKYLILAILLKK